MSPDEVVDLLAFIASYDQRTVGKADVVAWHRVLHSYALRDAVDAVTAYYAENTARVMPASVVAGIRTIGNRRKTLELEQELRRELGRAPTAPPPEFSAAREAFGQLPASHIPDVQRVRCPWCHARPGIRCTAKGGEGTLAVTYAHPARYAAAGAGPPRVDGQALADRRTPDVAP